MNLSLYSMFPGQNDFLHILHTFCKYDGSISSLTQDSVICWDDFVLPAPFINPFLMILPREPLPVAFRRAKFLLGLFNKSLKSYSAFPSAYTRIYEREIIYVVIAPN